jgi:hypothetical protein
MKEIFPPPLSEYSPLTQMKVKQPRPIFFLFIEFLSDLQINRSIRFGNNLSFSVSSVQSSLRLEEFPSSWNTTNNTGHQWKCAGEMFRLRWREREREKGNPISSRSLGDGGDLIVRFSITAHLDLIEGKTSLEENLAGMNCNSMGKESENSSSCSNCSKVLQ